MPVTGSIHVFASHKGGTGKTQLCFQCATQYAVENPDQHVMVFDMTELGDLTKRCLGGVSMDPEILNKNIGGIFNLIDTANKIEDEQNAGTIRRLSFMFRGRTELDIESASTKPSEFNAAMPENFYLISSGAATFEDEERTPEATLLLAANFREALEKNGKTWKVFIDTDGDRRPAPFTKLAYAIADACIIPVQPDESDFQRLEPMFQCMQGMYERGEMNTRIQMICWNKLQLYKREASNLGSFSTPKVTTDMIQHLNQKLYDLAKKHGDLFIHAQKSDVESFRKVSTVLVRDFADTVARPANANGIPYVCMQPGKIELSGGVVFMVKQDQIDGCVENVSDLLQCFDSMEEEY